MTSRTYKAKRKNWRELPKENQWVYGAIFEGKEKSYIITNVKVTDEWQDSEIGADVIGCLVDAETICQDTGLTDKNGRKIFEGDILQIETENLTKDDGYFTVEWSEPGCCFVLCGNKYLDHFDNVYKDFREVIGNIFDNPDLIGEQP